MKTSVGRQKERKRDGEKDRVIEEERWREKERGEGYKKKRNLRVVREENML